MSCEEVREELVALLDGELDPTAARRVRGHLETCAVCAKEERTLARARSILDESLAGSPARPGFDELWSSIAAGAELSGEGGADLEGARRRPSVARRAGRRGGTGPGRPWRWRAGLAAAGVVAAVLASRLVPSSPPSEEPGRVAGGPSAEEAARVAAEPGGRLAAAVPVEPPQRAVAEATRRASGPPPELREAPDMFVDFVIVRRLEKLRQLPELLAEERGQDDESDAGVGRS